MTARPSLMPRIALITGGPDAIATELRQQPGFHAPNAESPEAAAAAALAAYGHLDAWVHLVPAALPEPAEDVTAESWTQAVDAALAGTLRAAQTVGRHMLKRRTGTIVLVLARESASPVSAILNGGITGLGKVLAVEWADRGVRVVVVPRAGDPGQTVSTVRFALSEAANYVTGAVLPNAPHHPAVPSIVER